MSWINEWMSVKKNLQNMFHAERRNRRLGNYIDSRPPVGAPRWTVSNDWLEGMYPNCYKTVTIMFYAYRASRV